jgi:uncharacterized membrane protein HdeD (DUF308 family)
MQNVFAETVKDTIKHWYLILLLGIIFIVAGIWVFITPAAAYFTLCVFFSVTFLITGVIEIYFSILYRKALDSWGWSLVFGILDFLVGVILISQPQISIAVLPLFVGFVVLFRSIMAIGWAIELKKYKTLNWGMSLTAGILGVLFSLILLWNPVFAGLTLVFYTGFAFVMVGIFQIYRSLSLRSLKKYTE